MWVVRDERNKVYVKAWLERIAYELMSQLMEAFPNKTFHMDKEH